MLQALIPFAVHGVTRHLTEVTLSAGCYGGAELYGVKRRRPCDEADEDVLTGDSRSKVRRQPQRAQIDVRSQVELSDDTLVVAGFDASRPRWEVLDQMSVRRGCVSYVAEVDEVNVAERHLLNVAHTRAHATSWLRCRSDSWILR